MALTKNYEIRIKLVCLFIFPTTAMKNERYTYTLEKSKVFVNFRGEGRILGRVERPTAPHARANYTNRTYSVKFQLLSYREKSMTLWKSYSGYCIVKKYAT